MNLYKDKIGIIETFTKHTTDGQTPKRRPVVRSQPTLTCSDIFFLFYHNRCWMVPPLKWPWPNQWTRTVTLGTPEAQVEEELCCQENIRTLWVTFMIPPQPTLELLSSMLPKPMQRFLVYISQPLKVTWATGPLSEPLLSEVIPVSSCLSTPPRFQMICRTIVLEILDGLKDQGKRD